jgi:hypothetical protein
MLELYMHDYRSVIPADAFLVLGGAPEGTDDSTRCGLIARSDIEGIAP